MAKLLHCPFCGVGQSQVDLWFDDVARRYRVGCGRCGASTGTHPRDKGEAPAIAAWNTRDGAITAGKLGT
jgi:Lar family restriction alleviation protein